MPSATRADVAIVGAGIAGLAACVLLREQGLDVVCLDPLPHPHGKVGESLDWSSPGLLRRLGIEATDLIGDAVATYKRGIAVCETGRPEWAVAPPLWIRRRPLRFETATLHVDRPALDRRLCDRARVLGATFIWDQVTRIETKGDRVIGCRTSTGRRVEARWYLDASGTRRLFARAMAIPSRSYGCPKVCFWTYFDTPPLREGTTFFLDNGAGYLSWVWDIPISPTRTSVGFVLSADRLRELRRDGASVERILGEELARYPRFHALLDTQPIAAVERTSFQPYVIERAAGENWLMVGEAAAMPDPLTGNGVTSGIRHARHAGDAILAAGQAGELSRARRRMYERHVVRLGHSFNAHIERAIYQPTLRRGLGFEAAVYVYTIFAFFMNALHARFNPRRRAGMAAFACIFGAARAWIAGSALVGRAALRLRGPALDSGR